jgi:hypothetical protein
VNQTTLFALAEFPRQLAAHYAAIPEGHKHWRPPSWEGIPSEHYTALEQLCHVRDVETDGYHVRFERTLKESNPFLPALNGDALAIERGYATSDAGTVLADFQAARAHTIDLITRLTPEQFARTAEFEDYGPVTLRSLIHYLCSHDQQHLAGLQWLVGQIEALPVNPR